MVILAGLGLAILAVFGIAMWLAWKNRKRIGKLGILLIGITFIAVGISLTSITIGLPILLAGIVLVGDSLGIDIPRKIKQMR